MLRAFWAFWDDCVFGLFGLFGLYGLYGLRLREDNGSLLHLLGDIFPHANVFIL